MANLARGVRVPCIAISPGRDPWASQGPATRTLGLPAGRRCRRSAVCARGARRLSGNRDQPNYNRALVGHHVVRAVADPAVSTCSTERRRKVLGRTVVNSSSTGAFSGLTRRAKAGHPAARTLCCALVAVFAGARAVHAAVTPFFGVQAQQWVVSNTGMKMDYDWVRDRFVIQYLYGQAPPHYATIDLMTKAIAPLATTAGYHYETLLTVLPSAGPATRRARPSYRVAEVGRSTPSTQAARP